MGLSLLQGSDPLGLAFSQVPGDTNWSHQSTAAPQPEPPLTPSGREGSPWGSACSRQHVPLVDRDLGSDPLGLAFSQVPGIEDTLLPKLVTPVRPKTDPGEDQPGPTALTQLSGKVQ